MGIKTKIEWCDSTINPIMGCTGCALQEDHCYAAALCARYAGRKGWPKSFDEPEFFPGRLEKAVKWPDLTGKNRPDKPWFNGLPRHIFVNDMSDGFCPDADPWEWLYQFIPMMHLSPHIWLLLTKWPHRMRSFFEEWGKPIPSNFFPGVSIEDQPAADERVPILLQIPAAVRFVSVEPMLEAINLGLSGTCPKSWGVGYRPVSDLLDWVIVGGESGPGARPMMTDWAEDIVNQCQFAGVPIFMKQIGTWAATQGRCKSRKGADPAEWPMALQIREMPVALTKLA